VSPELRSVRTRDIIRALERDGFILEHQTGSHATFREGRRKVIVAIHSLGATIPIGTLHRIITSARWSDDDLRRLRLVRD